MVNPLDHTSTGNTLAVGRRTPEEMRLAQVKIATYVYDNCTYGDHEGVLRDILGALGLLAPVTTRSRRVYRRTCDGDAGTLRGYRRHLAAYDTPCSTCMGARLAELDARWRSLGIRDGEVVSPT